MLPYLCANKHAIGQLLAKEARNWTNAPFVTEGELSGKGQKHRI
jgi:hypothetical protein